MVGQGPQKPKTDSDYSSFAILSFTPILTVRSGARVAAGSCDPVSRRAARQHRPSMGTVETVRFEGRSSRDLSLLALGRGRLFPQYFGGSPINL